MKTLCSVLFLTISGCVFAETPVAPPLSPAALAASPDGTRLYAACETGARIAVVDAGTGAVSASWAVPEQPSGLTLNAGGSQLIVTSSSPQSKVTILSTSNGQAISTMTTGYGAMAPVLSPDGRTLYVCLRFNNAVAFLDPAAGKELRRVAVPREPVAMSGTPDGKFLVVANHLPHGRADQDHVAAVVSIVDTAAGSVCKELMLPNGSTLLRGVAVSPDGKFAAVTHVLGRFHLPTTQLDRGWVYTNALTLLDMTKLLVLNTVLLDNIDSGAANPWGIAWSADGARIVVSHAGTHELSIINAPALLEKLAKMPPAGDPNAAVYVSASRTAADVPNDLSFLVDVRRRVRLPDKGPRGIVLAGGRAYAANYFSDTLSEVPLEGDSTAVKSLALGPKPAMSPERLGELHWNDASLCFQGWLSCSSCHSSDARVDGLNWDNLNDGIGNPKNAKSLLLSFQTPPTTALGVRANAHVSVRSGIRNILFTVHPEKVATELDAFLSNLKPMPSPQLADGKMAPAAERGKAVFHSDKAGCADCHRPPLYTNLKSYDVGTHNRFDKPEDRFDTPTLVELWRSGPYLHDGSAVTLRDVFTTRNEKGKHGGASSLTKEEIDDLVAFLESL